MNFKKFTQDEIEEFTKPGLLDEGIGTFLVVDSQDVISKKSGNPMIKLELEVKDKHGKHGKIFDYIFYSEAAAWKIISFCKAASLDDALEVGHLAPARCLNKRGRCLIKHETDDKGEKRNKIGRYLLPTDSFPLESTEKKESIDFTNDDVPF